MTYSSNTENSMRPISSPTSTTANPDPVEHQNRRSASGTVVAAYPEPVDTLSRSGVAGRGTDKGHDPHSPSSSPDQQTSSNPMRPASTPNQIITPVHLSNDNFETSNERNEAEISTQSTAEVEHQPGTTLVLQWNINGLANNLGDLELLVRKYQPNAIALQEPRNSNLMWLNRILGGNYTWIVKRNTNTYRTVALGIKKSIPSEPITLDTNLAVVAARLELPVPFTVVCGYLPHGRIDNLENEFGNACSASTTPIIACFDANANHPAWGSARTCPRGRLLMNAIESHELLVLNDGRITRTCGEHHSAIDVTIASMDFAHRLAWNVRSDPLGSDHHPITVQIDQQPADITRRSRWKYEEADWTEFEQQIAHACRVSPPNNMEELMELILQAAYKTIPRTSERPGKKAVYWWSDETKKAVKARRKKLRAMKRAKERYQPEDQQFKDAVEAYRIERNTCRNIIRKAKRDSWTEFIEGINSGQSASDLWSRIRSLNGLKRHTGFTLEINNTLSQDPTEIGEALGSYFSELSGIAKYPPDFVTSNNASTNSLRNFVVPDTCFAPNINNQFQLDELNYALSRCHGKSAGPDNIGYPMLKKLPTHAKLCFLDSINQVWITGQLPSTWSESYVVPIPKQNNPGSSPSSFRPISLTCCASKVMERMINRRLVRWLEDSGLLGQRQHGFRPGKGSNTYFGQLSDILQTAFDEGLHVEVAALDLSKAYNRTWTPRVLQNLVDWGLGGNIIRFLKAFLTNRSFRVSIGSHLSAGFSEETGVPQGSVIAVTLFLIAMTGLESVLPRGITPLLYADDILLVAVGPTQKRLRRRLRSAVVAVESWIKSIGFELSPSKSVICHFCSSRHRINFNPVVTNSGSIPVKKTVRILGVRVDRSLNFRDHFNDIKENCKSRLNMIKAMAGPHRTNNRGVLLKATAAIIWSHLTYGLELFGFKLDNAIDTLGPLYNRSIRTACGLLPSTPADAACVEAGLLPFRYYLTDMLCRRAIGLDEKASGRTKVCLLEEGRRAFRSRTHQDLPPIARVHWVGARQWDLRGLKIETRVQANFGADGQQKNISTRTNNTTVSSYVHRILRDTYPDHCYRYTDGSKTESGVGFGVVEGSRDESFKLPNQYSIFSAELVAIFVAATTPSDKPIVILTDSASSVEALQSPHPQHPWVQNILKQAIANTVVMWIPSHSEIAGNEAADAAAAVGRTSRRYRGGKKIPGQDLRLWTRNTLRQAWESEWWRNRCHTRMIKDSTQTWNDRTSWREQRVLSRLRTGHTRATHHFGTGGNFHKNCERCGQRNTVDHFLHSGACLEDLRSLHGLTGSLKEILRNDPDMEQAVIRFCKDADLFWEI